MNNENMKEYKLNKVMEETENRALIIDGLESPPSEEEKKIIERIIVTLSSNNFKLKYESYDKPRIIRTKQKSETIALECHIKIYVTGSKVIFRVDIPICIMQDSVGNEALNTCIFAQNYDFGTLKRNREGEIYIQYSTYLKDSEKYDEEALIFFLNRLIEEAEQCFISLRELREELYRCLYRVDIEYMVEGSEDDFTP